MKIAYILLSIAITVMVTVKLFTWFEGDNLGINLLISLLGGIISMVFALIYHQVWGFKYFD